MWGKKGLSLWNEEEQALNSDYSNIVHNFFESLEVKMKQKLQLIQQGQLLKLQVTSIKVSTLQTLGTACVEKKK